MAEQKPHGAKQPNNKPLPIQATNKTTSNRLIIAPDTYPANKQTMIKQKSLSPNIKGWHKQKQRQKRYVLKKILNS